MSNNNRYSRQIQVDKIGVKGQDKLERSSVLIIGVGGLGCQVAAQLAGAGIGELSLVDHDTIELHNLHRQILFREKDIGEYKADIAGRELRKINSQIDVFEFPMRVNKKNLAELVNGADIVIDAADNVTTSYLLSDYCVEQRIPMLSASVNRTFGYVGIFCAAYSQPLPSFRAVFPRLNAPHPNNQQQNCDTVGVTGPGVGIIANIQAQEALKILLDDDAQLSARLLYLDLWNYQQHQINFSNAQEPDGQKIELIDQHDLTESDWVLDVRNADETKNAPLEYNRLTSIPLAKIKDNINTLPSNHRIVCACVSGHRAMLAAQLLLEQGIDNVAALIPNN